MAPLDSEVLISSNPYQLCSLAHSFSEEVPCSYQSASVCKFTCGRNQPLSYRQLCLSSFLSQFCSVVLHLSGMDFLILITGHTAEPEGSVV